jgi:hypothetical protein
MDTLRVFIRWLESIDGVPTDLHTSVRSPALSGDDNVRDVMLDTDCAVNVLEDNRLVTAQAEGNRRPVGNIGGGLSK